MDEDEQYWNDLNENEPLTEMFLKKRIVNQKTLLRFDKTN